MLDPLTALSLACNVVQFVDYGIKLVSEGAELYKAGSIANHDELELVINDLTRLTKDLAATQSGWSTSATAKRALSNDETALRGLAASCKEIGEELLTLLDSLKVRKSGKVLEDGIQSFRIALRSARKKGQIQNVENRLKRIQEQLSIRILALLKYRLHYTLMCMY